MKRAPGTTLRFRRSSVRALYTIPASAKPYASIDEVKRKLKPLTPSLKSATIPRMPDSSAAEPTLSPHPNSPFKLPEKHEYYGLWDHRLNPLALIERILGETAQMISDERSYDGDKVVEHLKLHGAHPLERTTTLGSGRERDAYAPYDEALYTGYHLFWYKGLIINVNNRDGKATLELTAPMSHPEVASIHNEFASFLLPVHGAAVSVLLSTPTGMTTKSIDFEPPVIDDLELNYGTGFAKVDAQIVEKLKAKKAGLLMMHGVPGTGKTYYIKHLTSRIDREFIFVPVGLAGELASPSFLNLLLEHEKAILVLEDAEQALQSRETDHWNSSTIATLLNIADGLLGTLLNISIIATYNADRQCIDKALLRKGRLAFDYTFEKLSVKDARRLAAHLKKDPELITEPTSLADIYNAEDNTGYVAPKQKVMGFGAAMKG